MLPDARFQALEYEQSSSPQRQEAAPSSRSPRSCGWCMPLQSIFRTCSAPNKKRSCTKSYGHSYSFIAPRMIKSPQSSFRCDVHFIILHVETNSDVALFSNSHQQSTAPSRDPWFAALLIHRFIDSLIGARGRNPAPRALRKPMHALDCISKTPPTCRRRVTCYVAVPQGTSASALQLQHLPVDGGRKQLYILSKRKTR